MVTNTATEYYALHENTGNPTLVKWEKDNMVSALNQADVDKILGIKKPHLRQDRRNTLRVTPKSTLATQPTR